MTKLTLPRRDFLVIAGASLTASAFPMVEAFGADAPLNFGFQETSWGTVGMICEAEDLFKKANAPIKPLHFDATRDHGVARRLRYGPKKASAFAIRRGTSGNPHTRPFFLGT